jgi:hypothetical protein
VQVSKEQLPGSKRRLSVTVPASGVKQCFHLAVEKMRKIVGALPGEELCTKGGWQIAARCKQLKYAELRAELLHCVHDLFERRLPPTWCSVIHAPAGYRTEKIPLSVIITNCGGQRNFKMTCIEEVLLAALPAAMNQAVREDGGVVPESDRVCCALGG